MIRERLERYDSHSMRSVYDRWPEIAQESYDAGSRYELAGTEGVNHIVFAGMGGSGALGDYYSSLLSKHDMHVTTVKGYNLPKTVDSDTLVVCSSVSGETAETMTVLRKASQTACRLAAFSSGGGMKAYCERNGIPHCTVRMLHSPRASFVAYAYTLLGALKVGARPSDVAESIKTMSEKRDLIKSSNMSGENTALKLAAQMSGLPVIYYPWGFQAAAIRFKNSLQENAKMHAIIEDVVEAGHNGIMAWEAPSEAQPILLRGADDNRMTKERWEIFREYFDGRDIPYITINSVGSHIMTKLACLVYELDYASIYLAAMRGVNPTSVGSIKYVRKRAGLDAI